MGKSKSYPGVYQILNIQNKKSYIGSSKSCLKRMQSHRYQLKRNVNHNPYLQNDWNIYGASEFVFRIIEHLNSSLTIKELEEYETKWVIQLKSNLEEFGYNITLPGNVRQKKDNANKFNPNLFTKVLTEYVCINVISGEVLNLSGRQAVKETTSISLNKIEDLCSYWKGKCKRKSLHGWIIVKKEEYNPEFDYVGYKKERKVINYKYGHKATWRDSYNKEDYRKAPEDIIPYKDRKMKRVSILVHNILTGEDRVFPMIKSCYPEFCLMKVRKCINNEFKKYKHRGHWFKRI